MTHDELMEKHHKILSTTRGLETPQGWNDLIDRLCTDLQRMSDDSGHQIEAVQVKSKFGGLRFYTGPSLDNMWKRISEAEVEAYKTCEVCGKPAKQHSPRGWVRTVCEEHAE